MAVDGAHVVVRKQTALSFLSFALLLGVALIGFWVMPTSFSAGEGWQVIVLSWLGILLFVWCLGTWHAVRREVLCPYIAFLCCSFLFTYGQCFLWALGLRGSRDLRDIFPSYQIARAQVFTLLAIGSFHAGALCSASRRSGISDSVDRNHTRSVLLYKSIRIVGWGLFMVSVVPFSILILKQVLLVREYGYGVLYNPSMVRTGLAAISNGIAGFFIPALICLFIGYRRNWLVLLFILTTIAIRMAIGFYVGGRSPAMVLVICVICMWHYFVSKISIKKGLIMLLLGYLLVSLLPAIGAFRSVTGRGFQDYIPILARDVGRGEQFIEAISEMGGSMFPLIQTMNLVPSQYPFRYGGSYFYSLFSLVPNLGFWEAHPSFRNANLGDWLQEALGLGYGPGFSPTAEAYINFGWAGILAMLILGVFYGRMFTLVDRNNATQRPDLASFVFILLSLVIMTNRNSFIATVRAVFYYSIPIYLATLMLSSYATGKRMAKLSKRINPPRVEL